MNEPREVRLSMCGWSVERIRAGRKTLTRRLKTSDRPPCKAGDTLVLTCRWAVHAKYDKMPPRDVVTTDALWTEWVGGRMVTWCLGRFRPARFVPRHLYWGFPRTKCLSMRAIRLQDISHEDALREGAGSIPEYMSVWDSLHRNRSWAVNPEVWRIEFAPVKGAPC